MEKHYKLYSAAKTLRDKHQIGKKHPTILDFIYLTFFLLVSSLILTSVQLHTAVVKANEAVNTVIVKKEIVQVTKEVIKRDNRVAKLESFLVKHNSPMAPYADVIVDKADEYGISWTKIVSISGIESNFGLLLPTGSHNAWGIGGSKFMYFKTWEEGIDFTSRLLSVNYKQNENQGIKEKYCPASDNCNPNWAHVVTKADNEILASREAE